MKALILNGPNLNMLGKRDKNHYGTLTLDALNKLVQETYQDVSFDFFQSNHEGDLIDKLQTSNHYDFMVINPAGLSHYSVSLRDAFELVLIPKAVVHLSNIQEREDYRKQDLFEKLADVYVYGKKENSYIEAIKILIDKYFN